MCNTTKKVENKVNPNDAETSNTKQQQDVYQDDITKFNETYNNAKNELEEEAGVDEIFFSSIPDHVMDTLLHADDNTFAKFLSERKLSTTNNKYSASQQQHSYYEEDNIQNEEEDNLNEDSTTTSISKPADNKKSSSFVEEESSCDPPPLILPPPGTVQYDDSFIEMVIRIVNQNRAARSNDTDKSNNNNYNQSQKKDDGDDSDTTSYDNNKLPFSSQNEKNELDDEHNSSSSLKVIEKARRANLLALEDEPSSLSFTGIPGHDHETFLFLQDDKIPSFLYNENDKEVEALGSKLNCDNNHNRKSTQLFSSNSVESRAKEVKGSPSQKSNDKDSFKGYTIQWDDELDKSCNSIEAIDLGVEEEQKNNIFEHHCCKSALQGGGEEEEENQLLFEKDYSSWLCFDDVFGYVTLKKSNDKDDDRSKATRLNWTGKETQEVDENAVVARPLREREEEPNRSTIENQLQREESINTVSKISPMKQNELVEIMQMTNEYKLREKTTRNIKSSFDDIDAIHSQSSSNKSSSSIRSNKDNQEHVLNDIDTFSRQHHKTSIIINAAKDKTSTNSVEMKRKSITTNTKKSIILEKSVHTTATKGSKSEEDRYIHSSPSSSNIENYIIATSTPNRNDSQQQAKDELFKTTPIKRRSQHQEDDTEYSNEFDYRSSPVRRRLLEEHTNDRERYMTPSPPFTFPQDNNKN